ncbi:MAG: amidohydrolase [Alphaproteobacteria bacterium]|uniref:Amidohydrolase n=1 Tax=Candidatus Nitrobium versatile TaxID=2884831 RepID=A0A953J3F9_9BACT|nr:amidohydrolase [Candidatus Nitrobium versatile]
MKRDKRSHQHEEKLVFPLPLKGVAEEGFSPVQTPEQRRVEELTRELAGKYSGKVNMTRRDFLLTSCGMATVFLAMNSVFGKFFAVDLAEAADPVFAEERRQALSGQFIFDVQTHFVSPRYRSKSILGLREMAKKWNPQLKGGQDDLEKIRFDNYYREVYELSDTKIALLTSAPNDDPKKWFIHNDEMAKARETVNRRAGRKVMYSHAVFTPGHPDWMEEVERAIAEYKPDAWKGYTTGTPFESSKYPWRLDDERLVYPVYERMVKAGITNVCIHKGLLPSLYKVRMAKTWEYGSTDDIGRAAKDWPQLNFIIYHSALQEGKPPSEDEVEEFEKAGYIPWVSDLASIPEKYGVKNVYAEVGATFALTAISQPRYCAGILGTLIKGMGEEHVVWGTDSVWFGSPQWQIEALRRLEIPQDMQKKFGYKPLGPADSDVKRKIFGRNAAALYKIQV